MTDYLCSLRWGGLAPPISYREHIAGARPLCPVSERELQPKLNDPVWFADCNHCCRRRQGSRDAARLGKNTALNAGRSGRRVTRIFPVGVVQNIEELRPKLQLDAFRQAKVFQ